MLQYEQQELNWQYLSITGFLEGIMKKKLKSLLAVFLLAAMVLSLAACGNRQEENQNKQEETSEYVYQASYESRGTDSSQLEAAVYVDDGYYASAYEKIGEREPEEGEVAEYEGQFDIYGYKIYFVSNDGKKKELAYKPLPAPEDTENRLNYYSGSNLQRLLPGEDGNLIAIESVYQNWFDGPESELDGNHPWDYYVYNETMYLRVLDKDCNELSCVELDFDVPEDSGISLYAAVSDGKGNILVPSGTNVLSFDTEGKLDYEIKGQYGVESLYVMRDGRIGATCWGDKGLELHVIDTENKSFGEKYDLPNDAYNLIPGDDTYDFYFNNGAYLYGLMLASGEKVKILNWVDCDVNGNSLNNIRILDDGVITGTIYDWSGEEAKVEAVTLKKVPASEVPHKDVLTLAVLYGARYDVMDMVINFNRHSSDCRISIKDYSEYNTDDDYSAGLTKLTTEIMAGNMPDLLAMSDLPYEQLAAKGLLEDLYPFLDADSELGREDIMDNVLRASEINGGLYQIASQFNVMSLIGSSKVVGDEPGWTYDELYEALATMPEGCDIMDYYATRDAILQALLIINMNSFVDWTTGKCSFEGKDFTDMLEFAAHFPETVPDDGEYVSDTTRIAEGKQMLMSAGIYDIDDSFYNNSYFGGSITYIGYPTNEGVGNVLNLTNNYGMSSSCKNKEAAWQFLRGLLTMDSQRFYGLPTNKNLFEQKMKAAMTPEYEEDENGNIRLDENGEKIMIPRSTWRDELGNEVVYYALTEEDAAKLREAIVAADRLYTQDTGLVEIVQEMTKAYFAGQKSAEEVARLVQSKVSIYVNEHR